MKLLSGFTLIFMLFMCSCKKERATETFVSYDDTTWRTLSRSFIHPLDTLFNAAYTETLTTNVSATDTIHFSNHVDIYCPPGFCTSTTGGAVSGTVNLSLLHLKTKGDFVRFARPAVSNTEGLLNNAAAFKITAAQNKQQLTLAPGKYVNIRYTVSADLHTDNLPLYGDTTINNTGNFTWLTVSPAFLQPFSTGAEYGYNMQCFKLGWMGCGRMADNNNAATSRLIVVLPPVCTNKTASVYAVFRNQHSVVRLTPEISARVFATGKIPAGTDITLVVMAKTNSNYYLETVNITTAPSGWQVLKIKPGRSNKQQISELLDTL